MTFELESFTACKLRNFNPRAEKHGPESVMACDLNFILDVPNSVLSEFDGGLLSAMYEKTEAVEDDQYELDGVEPVSHLPNLRFPKMAPIKWDSKHAGYSLCIDYGIGDSTNIELEGCDLGKFVLDLKEGGTVEVKFQVQCQSGLTERIMGKLAMLIGQEVSITLLAPTMAGTATMDLPENPMPFKESGVKALTAEDVFLGKSVAAVH